jgi:nitrogen fixation protein FixH
MKFKLNWGFGITVAIVLFMTFILTFVFRAARVSNDLYAEDYYQQELDFQSEIDAISAANMYKDDLYFSQNDKEIVVHFKSEMPWNQLNAKLYFYRPDDAKMDRNITFLPQNGIQLIAKEYFKNGNYEVKLKWKQGKTSFLVKQNLYVEIE